MRELGFRTVCKPPRSRRLYGGGLGTVPERSRNGLGTVSETGPLARPREGFARFELRGRRSTFARSSIDFVAGAALSRGRVQISWQAQHFRKVLRPLSASWGIASCRNVGAMRELGFRTVRKPPRSRRLYGGGLGTVPERSRNGLGTVSETGPLARPREGFARFELRGRRSTFARSSIDFVAGAALSRGRVQISWQAQHFRKVLRPLSASWGIASCRNVGAMRELGFRTVRKPPRSRRLYGGGLGTVPERSRNGLGTVSETGPLARPREGFARFELRGRCSTFARSSIDFVAGAALSQGRVQISWQAQHFRKVLRPLSASWGIASCRNVGAMRELGFRTVRKPPRSRRLYGGGLGTVPERSRNGLGTVSETGPLARPREGFARFELRGRCSTFARSSIDFVAGAALSQGQVPNSWQAQHFRKVKYKIRGRRSTFARSSTEFVAGAALSQGQVQNSWHAQHFRKVKYRFCGRRSTLARSSTDLVAGAAFLQGQLSQPGLENRNF